MQEIFTSLGSANIPTIEASIASWFSTLDALAASNITVSLSQFLGKTFTNGHRKKVNTKEMDLETRKSIF